MDSTISKRIYFCTFLLAAAVLQLEVALTKIFSVLTWHHFTNMIIGIALLGFGAAGSLLTLKNTREPGSLSAAFIARNAYFFALSTVLSLLLVTRLQFEPLAIGRDWTQLLSLFFYYLILVMPFFFAGTCLGSIITVYQHDVNRVYFADLFGAGIGALGSVAAIQYFGATNTVFFVAVLAGLVGLLMDSLAGGRYRLSGWLKLAVFCLVFLAGMLFDPYLVHTPPSKELTRFFDPWRNINLIDYSRWHVVARIDVTQSRRAAPPAAGGDLNLKPPVRWEHRRITQDGAASTFMLKSDGDIAKMTFLDKYLQSAPYQILKDPDTLVIGVGGGVDVLIALYDKAKFVTGVEVNPLTVNLIKKKYAEYTGNLFNRPDVRIVTAEGRHFISTDRSRYDIIQLSGVDTFAAVSSGAYALTENYLYTVEAMGDFWNHLSDQGILSFSRWYFQPPRETIRVVTMMVQAMENAGVKNIASHLLILNGAAWADTMLKKTPFSPAEVQVLRAWAAKNGFSVMYDPLLDKNSEFDRVIRSTPEKRQAFYSQYPYKISPPSDDRPFFFDYYKWSSLFSKEWSKYGYGTTNFPLGLRTMVFSLAQILLLAFLGIVYPLRKLKESLFAEKGRLAVLTYFGALGLGFIFVEIALIQKLMVFLGGPTYSLTISLFAMLLFSGLGSFFARRITMSARRLFLALPIALFALILIVDQAFTFFIPRWQQFGLFGRGLLAVLLLAPLAFCMGMPFPLGIKALSGKQPGWVPWAWASNSFFSVFGSIFCIFLSMQFGFRLVFFAAAAIYLAGILIFRWRFIGRD